MMPQAPSPARHTDTNKCAIGECTKFGAKVMPGLVLCRYHRKRVYHRLCEIYTDEQQRIDQPPPKPKSKDPARKPMSRTAKRKRDQEIRAVAMNAAGPSVYRFDLTKIGYISECSGGLPTLGRDR
jgi:hypothetical protein